MEAPTQPFPEGADMNIPEAIAAAKGAYDLVAVGIAARDDAKVKSALADLQAKLLDALSIAVTQVQSTHTLELELQKLRVDAIKAEARQAELERQLEQRSQYKLTEVAQGKLVRELVEPSKAKVSNPKYFCATCYGEGREIPLNFIAKDLYGGSQLSCPTNKQHTLHLSQDRSAQLYPSIGIV
jgi:hypothetical protein